MKIIGLTGGIACGKSSVSRELRVTHGFPVVDADAIAHEVQKPGSRAYRRIVAAFGDSILNEDGSIDRPTLGRIVFADAAKRRQLNQIMHPAIGWSLLRALLLLWLRGSPLVLLDAPLLFESGLHRVTRCVVAVACRPEQQLQRLVARDGMAPAEAEQRIAAQMPAEEKARRSQYVVDNSGPWTATVPQLAVLAERLRCERRSLLADVLLAPLGLALMAAAVAGAALLRAMR